MTALGAIISAGWPIAALAHPDDCNDVAERDQAVVCYSSMNDVIDLGKAAGRSIRIGRLDAFDGPHAGHANGYRSHRRNRHVHPVSWRGPGIPVDPAVTRNFTEA